MIFIPEQSSDVFHSIIKDSKDVINFSLILEIFPKEISFSWAIDDVFSDCCWFWEFEVTINEVGKVGEIQSNVDFIFFEPFILIVILNLFELGASVWEKVADILSKSSDFPIA